MARARRQLVSIADPIALGRGFAAAGGRLATEGFEIAARLHADLREQWTTKPVGLGVAEALAGMVRPKPIRENLVSLAIEAERVGRLAVAGLMLAELRISFGRDADWRAFAGQHLPFGLERAEHLIGAVVHRNSMAYCAKCKAGVRCECSCGVPYIPEVPWEREPAALPEPVHSSSALERALAAIKAEPGKSNRLIAKEIGVADDTVRRARKKYEADRAPDRAPVRVGADGKSYHLPTHSQRHRKAPPPDDGSLANELVIAPLVKFATAYVNTINEFDDRKLRTDFTREDRDAIADTFYSIMNDLGLLAQRFNDVTLEQHQNGGIHQ
jgi:hypothetical protein